MRHRQTFVLRFGDNSCLFRCVLWSALVSILPYCKTRPEADSAETRSISDTCDGEEFTQSVTPAVKVDNGGVKLKSKAALIYYAVDTSEPFMQASVDEEIRALRRSCNPSLPNVNWIVFTNSYYFGDGTSAGSKKFLMCKNGHGGDQVMHFPPSLVSRIEEKRQWIAQPLNNQKNPLKIQVPYPSEVASTFGQYPLAHPDILHDLMDYAGEQFSANTYTPFLHLKSHGSRTIILTGLTAEQTEKKALCQKKTIASKGITLGQIGLGQVGLGQVGLGQVGLGQVGLGQVGLGQVGLGQVGLGVGNPGGLGASGLGEHGLSTANHFGSPSNFVLASIFDVGSTASSPESMYFGFVMLESCDSNVPAQSFTGRLLGLTNKIDAYYSAAGSLWYRNLNWDELFATWSGGHDPTPASLQALLIQKTSQIPNYFMSAAAKP